MRSEYYYCTSSTGLLHSFRKIRKWCPEKIEKAADNLDKTQKDVDVDLKENSQECNTNQKEI